MRPFRSGSPHAPGLGGGRGASCLGHQARSSQAGDGPDPPWGRTQTGHRVGRTPVRDPVQPPSTPRAGLAPPRAALSREGPPPLRGGFLGTGLATGTEASSANPSSGFCANMSSSIQNLSRSPSPHSSTSQNVCTKYKSILVLRLFEVVTGHTDPKLPFKGWLTSTGLRGRHRVCVTTRPNTGPCPAEAQNCGSARHCTGQGHGRGARQACRPRV